MKKLLNNKVFRVISKIIKYILVVILLLFVFVVFLQRFSHNKVSFFNYRIFVVVTGSMEPRYNVGDIYPVSLLFWQGLQHCLFRLSACDGKMTMKENKIIILLVQ